MSLKKRQAAIEDFRTSTRTTGHRVLIISNVGTVGLNLACANIMVIVDTTWSALDDEQLRGRIFRYPQKKQVHFYRLIALGTPDVFLNNISFDKGQLHSAFVGCAKEIQGLFEPDFVNDDRSVLSITPAPTGDDSAGEDDDKADDDDGGPSVTPKQKARGVDDKPRRGKSTKGKAKAVRGTGRKTRQVVLSDDDAPVNNPGSPSQRTPDKKGGGVGGSKCPLGSPPGAVPQKKSKRKRAGTVTPATAGVSSLTEAAAAMHVDASDDTAALAAMDLDPDVVVEDPTPIDSDPILAQLRTAGGENDPDEDEELARQSLRTPPGRSSPLTLLSSTQEEPHHHSATNSIPHREPPVAQSSSTTTTTATFRAAKHGGDLGKTKDGSGGDGSKPKVYGGKAKNKNKA